MKKSLSLLLALAMVLGMFASVAAAADNALTTEQKYQQLVDGKVLKGTTDGKSHLEDNLTRAEFATIAVAVAGLEEDTASASAFADVKAGQWWTGAITAANKAGLVNGVGNGNFSPKANVTVQEAIKVAVLIAKLTPVADAKVEGAADWAGPYIKAAQDAGLPLPTNYKEAATRGQTVDIAFAVFQSLQVKPLDEVKAVVNADDTITVTGKTAGGVDGVKVAVGTGEAAAATLNADGTFTFTTAKQAVGSYTLTVTAYKGTAAVKSAEVTAMIDGFTVSSVTVLNGKQIAVQFSKGAQAGTATNGAELNTQYKLDGTNPTRVSLSDDKTTATLTWAGGLAAYQDKYVQFEVLNSVYSLGGTAVTGYKNALLVSDSTAPSVTVTNVPPNVEVAFSEPVRSNNIAGGLALEPGYGSLSVDGVQKTAADYTLVADNTADAVIGITKIKIANLSAGTHTIALVGVRDIMGKYLPDYSTTVTVATDSTLPSVTSLVAEGSMIRVKTSESLASTTLNGTTAYIWLTDGTNNIYGTSANMVGSSANEFLIDATSFIPGTTATNNFVNANVVVKQGYKDASNNTVNTDSGATTLTITRDNAAPTVSGTIINNNQIIVKFNEAIQAGSAPITTGLKLKLVTPDNILVDKTSVPATVTAVAYQYDADTSGDGGSGAGENAYLVLTLDGTQTDIFTSATSNKLKNGSYTITIPANAVKDKSAAMNPITSDISATFTVTGSTSSNANLGVTYPAVLSTVGSTVDLTFTAALADSALNTNNFTINSSVIPSNSTVQFVGDKLHVRVTLPAGFISVTGTRTLAVKDIVDQNGNTLNSAATTGVALNFKELVKPTASSVTLTASNQATVTFSEVISAASLTGVEVWINGTKQDLTAAGWNISKVLSSGADTNKVLISAPNNTFALGQTIIVKFAGASGITDAAGNSVADGQVQL